MLAQLPHPGLDRRRDHQHVLGIRPHLGLGEMALLADPVGQQLGRHAGTGILHHDLDIGVLVGRGVEILVVMGIGQNDGPLALGHGPVVIDPFGLEQGDAGILGAEFQGLRLDLVDPGGRRLLYWRIGDVAVGQVLLLLAQLPPGGDPFVVDVLLVEIEQDVGMADGAVRAPEDRTRLVPFGVSQTVDLVA